MYKKDDGLPHVMQVHGQSLANAQTLPQNTSADGNEGPLKVGGAMGAFELLVRVNAAIAIADTKALTVKLQHRDGTDVFADLATIYTITAAAGSGALAKGKELARFALPSTVKNEIKAVISTTDAAASGKIDVLPVYLPR